MVSIAHHSTSPRVSGTEGSTQSDCSLNTELMSMLLIGMDSRHCTWPHKVRTGLKASNSLSSTGSVNVTSVDGTTPLHLVANSKLGHETARSLLENGADIKAADRKMQTPLPTAVV